MLSGAQKEEGGKKALVEHATESFERLSGKVAYSTGDGVSLDRRCVRRIPALRGRTPSGHPPPQHGHHRPHDRGGFLPLRRKLDQVEQVDEFTFLAPRNRRLTETERVSWIMDHGSWVVERMFPKVAKCTWYRVSRVGQIDVGATRERFSYPTKMYDCPEPGLRVRAVLQLHLREAVPGRYRRRVLYGAENVFQVLWFYYVLAVLASAGLILFRLAVCASPALRCRILLPRRVAATKKIRRCIRNGTVRHST